MSVFLFQIYIALYYFSSYHRILDWTMLLLLNITLFALLNACAFLSSYSALWLYLSLTVFPLEVATLAQYQLCNTCISNTLSLLYSNNNIGCCSSFICESLGQPYSNTHLKRPQRIFFRQSKIHLLQSAKPQAIINTFIFQTKCHFQSWAQALIDVYAGGCSQFP